jgi:hypothetical protein
MEHIQAKTYLRYLELRKKHLNNELDSLSEQLLNEIGARRNERLTVTKLISLDHLASQATLFVRITKLIALGYLEKREAEHDHRIKYVTLGKTAHRFFAQQSKLMLQAIEDVKI